MPKRAALALLILLSIACSLAVVGCGAPDKPVPHASATDQMKGNASRAKDVLDMLEDLPAEERQAAANKPRNAAVLKAAMSDSATSTRIKNLGIQVQ